MIFKHAPPTATRPPWRTVGSLTCASTLADTFFREDFPQEFNKLGQTRRIQLANNEVLEVQEVLELPIEPPTFSGWHGAFYTNVQVFLLPLETTERTIPVKIMKEGTSVFFREDGSLRNAERFLHQSRERLVDYFTEDCAPSSMAMGVQDLIRFSPYGTWKLMVPRQFGDLASLAGVNQIRFEFTIRASTTTIQGIDRWPLFANDRVSPDSHSVLRPNADPECLMDDPTVPFGSFSMLTPFCAANRTCIRSDDGLVSTDDGPPSGASDSSEDDGGISTGIGVLIGVLLLILVVIIIFVAHYTGHLGDSSELALFERNYSKMGREKPAALAISAFMDDMEFRGVDQEVFDEPERVTGFENPMYAVSVTLPPSPTISSPSKSFSDTLGTGDSGSNWKTNTIYEIPMADGNMAAVSQVGPSDEASGYLSVSGVADATGNSDDVPQLPRKLTARRPDYAEATNEGLLHLAPSSETAKYPHILGNGSVSDATDAASASIGAIGPGDDVYGNQVVVDYHAVMTSPSDEASGYLHVSGVSVDDAVVDADGQETYGVMEHAHSVDDAVGEQPAGFCG